MEGKTWRDLVWIDDDPSKGLDRDKMDWVPRLKAGDEVFYEELPKDLEQDLLDLREIDMSDFKVTGKVDLSYVCLPNGVDLTGITLVNGKRSFMRGANLENADLIRAKLENANLIRAKLENADLIHAKLENADLRHANLEKAK
jgi:uncharacterized protein YjbI with pentapeptide repeats